MRLALVLSLFAAGSAFAHDADIIYAQVERADGSTNVKELLTMTAATLVLLAPVDPDRDGIVTKAELAEHSDAIRAGVWGSLPLKAGEKPCALSSHSARFRETYVELTASFDCGEGELIQTFRVLSILPKNYKIVLGTFMNGEAGARFAEGNAQTLVLDGPGTRISSLLNWIGLGLRHIFGGLDHLMFLLGLLVTARTVKQVLLMVTSFTVAHSITLGLTAAGIIQLSARSATWVEVAIAISIIWVGVENLVLKEHKHRAVLTFVFGLIHGFGFATSLRAYGIERELATALFGFNLGVELGQLAVVLVIVPGAFWLRRTLRRWPWVVRGASLIIIAAGGYWLVERAVG